MGCPFCCFSSQTSSLSTVRGSSYRDSRQNLTLLSSGDPCRATSCMINFRRSSSMSPHPRGFYTYVSNSSFGCHTLYLLWCRKTSATPLLTAFQPTSIIPSLLLLNLCSVVTGGQKRAPFVTNERHSSAYVSAWAVLALRVYFPQHRRDQPKPYSDLTRAFPGLYPGLR